MDYIGQGVQMSVESHDKYIINSSGNVSLLRRVWDVLLTVILWILYVYFMWDFFIYCGHLLQWWLTGKSSQSPDLKILHTLLIYAEAILCLGSALIGWAMYNLLRFRGKARRKSAPPVTSVDLAAFYGHPVNDIENWQKKRVLVMHHSENGQLISVDVRM
jgi:biofilm PGA synthesis protein PgaD